MVKKLHITVRRTVERDYKGNEIPISRYIHEEKTFVFEETSNIYINAMCDILGREEVEETEFNQEVYQQGIINGFRYSDCVEIRLIRSFCSYPVNINSISFYWVEDWY